MSRTARPKWVNKSTTCKKCLRMYRILTSDGFCRECRPEKFDKEYGNKKDK